MTDLNQSLDEKEIYFFGGILGALIPFIVFVAGVIIIALSGAPDERGFWPVLIFALGVGLILSKDKEKFCIAVLDGMSQKIVMIMITAWILASIIGVLMTVSGFVEALNYLVSLLHLGGVGFTISAFIICCIVSLSTGSSFATILICGPILYPAGGLLETHLPTLAGAIIGGATFGDFVAPISDTTIASALSQKAAIGPTVRSRVKYILPATLIALVGYYLSATFSAELSDSQVNTLDGDPNGLPMMLVPILIIALFIRGKHLLHGLLLGLFFGIALALVAGLITPHDLIHLDLEKRSAQSFIIDGINRAVGLSIFTILLMGLVGSLKASGVVNQLVDFASTRSKNARQAEAWIAGTVGGAVLLTTHSIVAILMVSEFASKTGEDQNVSPVRRSNILSLVVCVLPFILPYFIPVILMSNMTSSGESLNIPAVSPLDAGLYNFVSWALLGITILVVVFGYGRKADNQLEGVANTESIKQSESHGKASEQ